MRGPRLSASSKPLQTFSIIDEVLLPRHSEVTWVDQPNGAGPPPFDFLVISRIIWAKPPPVT